jgi:hypothetical protein
VTKIKVARSPDSGCKGTRMPGWQKPREQKARRPDVKLQEGHVARGQKARLQGGRGCEETILSGGQKDKKRPGLYCRRPKVTRARILEGRGAKEKVRSQSGGCEGAGRLVFKEVR